MAATAVTVSVNTADVVSTVAANINTAVGYSLASVVGGELKLVDAGANKITVGGTASGAAAAGFSTTTSSATAGAVESVDAIVVRDQRQRFARGQREGVQQRRSAADHQPVDLGADRHRRRPAERSTAARVPPSIGGNTVARKPGHAVQPAERPARQDRGRLELQRHQPAQRRSPEAVLQREQHQLADDPVDQHGGRQQLDARRHAGTNAEFQSNSSARHSAAGSCTRR